MRVHGKPQARRVRLLQRNGKVGLPELRLVGPDRRRQVAAARHDLDDVDAPGLALPHRGPDPVDAVRAALAVGADSIEHCTLFTVDGVANDPELLEHLAMSRSVLSMTAAATPGSEPPFPAIRQRIEAILANHRHLYQSGARVVCSSDAGVGPTKPHDVLPHGAVTFLPMLGMSNAEAIINVTADAAAACGISDRTGTLEPGKDADVLVVAGDPLTDLSALHNVLAVFARGKSAPG